MSGRGIRFGHDSVDELGVEAGDEPREHERPADDEDGAGEGLAEVNGDLWKWVSGEKGLMSWDGVPSRGRQE